MYNHKYLILQATMMLKFQTFSFLCVCFSSVFVFHRSPKNIGNENFFHVTLNIIEDYSVDGIRLKSVLQGYSYDE